MLGRRLGWVALLMLAVSGLPAWADSCPEDEPKGWRFHRCPPPSYTPLHYHTPALYRAYGCLFHYKLSPYAPNRHPHIPPTYRITEYPCPAVDPAALYADRQYLP